MKRLGRACALLGCAFVLGGCLLPSFKQSPADAGKAKGTGADAGAADAGADAAPLSGDACGLSDKLPGACDACIRENCCDLAKACGEGTDCGKDLLEPITPAADFSTDFDPLLGCMQTHCEQPCQVNWGCVDNYHWPTPDADLKVGVRVIDFAAVPDKPLPDVRVKACQPVDPSCTTGRVDEATTGDDGMVALTVQSSFNGLFDFSGGGYVDSNVQWSEPIYRVGGFTQYQLTNGALQVLAGIVGVDTSFDPETGFLIFRVQGCLPMRYLNAPDLPRAEAPDVEVSFEPNDGASPIFYTDPSGGVSVTLKATTRDGVGGAFNVPARPITVHAVDTHSGMEVATGTVQIQPGVIGYVYLVARSLP